MGIYGGYITRGNVPQATPEVRPFELQLERSTIASPSSTVLFHFPRWSDLFVSWMTYIVLGVSLPAELQAPQIQYFLQRLYRPEPGICRSSSRG